MLEASGTASRRLDGSSCSSRENGQIPDGAIGTRQIGSPHGSFEREGRDRSWFDRRPGCHRSSGPCWQQRARDRRKAKCIVRAIPEPRMSARNIRGGHTLRETRIFSTVDLSRMHTLGAADFWGVTRLKRRDANRNSGRSGNGYYRCRSSRCECDQPQCWPCPTVIAR